MVLNRITINGVTVEVEGDDVVIRQGVIYIDGVAVQSQLSGDIHVHWHGDLASLTSDGSVTCRDVDGDVTAGGSVQCRHVEGSVSAGGSIHAGGGSVTRGSASAVGFAGDIKVEAVSRTAYARGGDAVAGGTASVKIGHGEINVGDINAGGSVHARSRSARYGRINAGGSIHLD